MLTSMERRLNKLEGPKRQAVWHFLEGWDGETSRDCIIRHGLSPNAPGGCFFVSQGLFPEGYLNGRQQ